MIQFRGVKKAFGRKPILKGVDLQVGAAEVMFVISPPSY